MVGIPSSQTKGGTLSYVDNLGTADYKFKPGDEVSFQLKVKNTANTVLQNVTVKDFVPAYLAPIEGPGSFDEKSKMITFSAGDFAINKEKTYTLKMRIIQQNQLPQDKGLFCIINKATAETGNATDEDTVQLCIEKQVIGVEKVPSAGPTIGVFFLPLAAALLSGGIYLKVRFQDS